jgi:hypothetical protein
LELLPLCLSTLDARLPCGDAQPHIISQVALQEPNARRPYLDDSK